MSHPTDVARAVPFTNPYRSRQWSLVVYHEAMQATKRTGYRGPKVTLVGRARAIVARTLKGWA